MNNKILLILFLFFLAASTSIEKSEVAQNETPAIEVNFEDLRFGDQLVYLISHQHLLDSQRIISALNDSVENNDWSYFISMDGFFEDSITFSFEKFTYGDVIFCPKMRNVYWFSIDHDDSIYVRNELINSWEALDNSMIHFIGDYGEGYDFPEFKRKTLPLLGDTFVSRHFFEVNANLIDSIPSKRSDWKNVFFVLEKIKLAYDRVRKKAAFTLWGLELSELNMGQKEALLALHPIRIHFHPNNEYLKPVPPPPPPPPADSFSIEMIVDDDPFDSEVVRNWKADNPQLQKLDSSYSDYWCSIKILRNTSDNIEHLNISQVADFLATFHPSCSTNVGFSEWSNELLFKIIRQHPTAFLSILYKNSSLSRNFILEEIESPVTDIELESVISSVQSVDEEILQETQEIILQSLERAKSKSD